MFAKEPIYKALTLASNTWVQGGVYRQEDDKLVIVTLKDKHYFVKPETLCMNTGFTDENGDMIFTGDCLENKRYQELLSLGPGLVKMYDEGTLYLQYRYKTGNGNHAHGLDRDLAKKCVIIGNHFDKQIDFEKGLI